MAAAGRPEASVPGAGPAAILTSLGPVERSLAELLAAGPATADDLALRTGLSCASVLSALTLLELRGLVCGSYGRYVPAGSLARCRTVPRSPEDERSSRPGIAGGGPPGHLVEHLADLPLGPRRW